RYFRKMADIFAGPPFYTDYVHLPVADSPTSPEIRHDTSESADYPQVYLWVFQSPEALPTSGVASRAWISESAGVDHRYPQVYL
ncbi:hypothetical protein K439DRAFT_1349812, partial [Ramaria rubella]